METEQQPEQVSDTFPGVLWVEYRHVVSHGRGACESAPSVSIAATP